MIRLFDTSDCCYRFVGSGSLADYDASGAISDLAFERLSAVYTYLGYSDAAVDSILTACKDWSYLSSDCSVAVNRKNGKAVCVPDCAPISKEYYIVPLPPADATLSSPLIALRVIAHLLTDKIIEIVDNADDDFEPVSSFAALGGEVDISKTVLPCNYMNTESLYRALFGEENYYENYDLFLAACDDWINGAFASCSSVYAEDTVEMYLAYKDGAPLTALTSDFDDAAKVISLPLDGKTYVHIPLEVWYVLADPDGSLCNVALLFLCWYMVNVF